jgi:hypothetical protein
MPKKLQAVRIIEDKDKKHLRDRDTIERYFIASGNFDAIYFLNGNQHTSLASIINLS